MSDDPIRAGMFMLPPPKRRTRVQKPDTAGLEAFVALWRAQGHPAGFDAAQGLLDALAGAEARFRALRAAIELAADQALAESGMNEGDALRASLKDWTSPDLSPEERAARLRAAAFSRLAAAADQVDAPEALVGTLVDAGRLLGMAKGTAQAEATFLYGEKQKLARSQGGTDRHRNSPTSLMRSQVPGWAQEVWRDRPDLRRNVSGTASEILRRLDARSKRLPKEGRPKVPSPGFLRKWIAPLIVDAPATISATS